jgi:hypothetical protein
MFADRDRQPHRDLLPCLLELLFQIRGMQNTFFDIVANPDILGGMLLKAADFSIEIGEKSCDKFPLDWLWTGYDVGGQLSMMISPDLRRGKYLSGITYNSY